VVAVSFVDTDEMGWEFRADRAVCVGLVTDWCDVLVLPLSVEEVREIEDASESASEGLFVDVDFADLFV
jgi:hypothetical protein